MNESLNKEIVEIPVEDIVPNRFQPRLTFDVEALNDLANSIREHGIIQPLVVRKLQDKYEIIAGERRYKAAALIGMQKVPCIVMNLNDNESAEVAVIENIQRKEMTPLEEAKSFKKILDKGYLTQDELAKRMGKSQSSIANKLRLLNLDEIVQEAILNGKISERHARSLLKVENKIDQRNLLNEIIDKRLTVRQTDELIKERYGTSMNNNEVNNTMEISTSSIFKEPVIEQKEIQKTNPYEGFKSTPEVNIPISNLESNPQTNLMQIHDVNIPNANATNQNEQIDINTNMNKVEDISNIINPSVFSTTPIETNNSNEGLLNNNSMNIDVNEIKNNAMDIIQKQEPTVNVSNLLSSEKPENKFFVDLDMPDANFEDQIPLKVKNAIDSINRKIDEIKLQGTMVFKEEKDLGNSYQITIRIDK